MSSTDHDDEAVSEAGGEDLYRAGAAASKAAQPATGVAPTGFTRTAGIAPGFGRGPIARDSRKYRYDTNAAKSRKAVPFGATKIDRMDAADAGNLLHDIHTIFGIQNEVEERIHAFDQALWYEHAVNGGSTLQASRGSLYVDGIAFDLGLVVTKLGVNARRFFRAYADDIADCLASIIAKFDPYDPESVEKHGAIMQVAVSRGLQKYPAFIQDSSDAGLRMSIEERAAVIASKRLVLPGVVNNADAPFGRVSQPSSSPSLTG